MPRENLLEFSSVFFAEAESETLFAANECLFCLHVAPLQVTMSKCTAASIKDQVA
jgi:hypothetical protein